VKRCGTYTDGNIVNSSSGMGTDDFNEHIGGGKTAPFFYFLLFCFFQ
jgi:hypothetical protein